MAQQVAQEFSGGGAGIRFRHPRSAKVRAEHGAPCRGDGKGGDRLVEPRVSNPAQALAGGGDFTHIMNALSQI